MCPCYHHFNVYADNICKQNKEAEAKEELKRRAKQLEMQRREQQRRTAGGSGGSNYLGGGISGYAAVPRFEAPEPASHTPSHFSSTSASTPTRTPAFKGSGMKLGAKKTKQAELLDALGGDVLASTGAGGDLSGPPTPVVPEPPAVQKANDGRGSLPEVEKEKYVSPHYLIGVHSKAEI